MRRRFNRGGWRGPGPPTGPFELNKESPQARGLVAWYPTLGNGAKGRVLKNMAGTQVLSDGILTGANADYSATQIKGRSFFANQTTSATAWVDLGSSQTPLDANSPFSVSLWMFITTVSSIDGVLSFNTTTGNGWIFVLGENPGNFDAMSMGSNSDTPFQRFNIDQNQAFDSIYGFNKWHHLSVTYNGQGGTTAGNWRVYMNGVSRSLTSVGVGWITANSGNMLARHSGSTTQVLHSSHLSDVRLYHRNLIQSDVLNIYTPATRYDLYKPILPKFVVVAPAAPGGDLSINVSDSVSVSESVTMEITSFVDVSDSVSAAEAVNLAIVHQVNVADSVSVAESVNLAIAQQISVSDSVTVSDTPTLMVDENISVSDAISVSESVSVSVIDAGTITINVSESISVSESVTMLGTSIISVSDSVTVTEAVTMLGTSIVSVADAISVTDTPTMLGTSFIDVSDSVSVSESVSVTTVTVGTLTISVSESVTVSEAVVMALTPLLINVSESVTVADVVTMSLLVGLIDLTLRDRDTSLTLRDRDTSLTLNERY